MSKFLGSAIWKSATGLPDGLFSNQNPNLCKFWRALEWYILWSWSILHPIGIFYGHLVNFVLLWYIFHHFGMLYQEKSGNPGLQ
jgi:hypothetical protein